MGQTGLGGYGGISTMNQDQRQGHMGPHTVSKYLDRMADVYHMKCVKCKQEWQITVTQWHARTVEPLPVPPTCEKPASASEASADVEEDE